MYHILICLLFTFDSLYDYTSMLVWYTVSAYYRFFVCIDLSFNLNLTRPLYKLDNCFTGGGCPLFLVSLKSKLHVEFIINLEIHLINRLKYEIFSKKNSHHIREIKVGTHLVPINNRKIDDTTK